MQGEENRHRGRVAVIGAGIAGLTAAYRLEQAGFEATVFDARDRVGGRMWSVRRGDFLMDLGAAFYLGTYREAIDLIHEVGLGQRLTTRPASGAIPRASGAGHRAAPRARGGRRHRHRHGGRGQHGRRHRGLRRLRDRHAGPARPAHPPADGRQHPLAVRDGALPAARLRVPRPRARDARTVHLHPPAAVRRPGHDRRDRRPPQGARPRARGQGPAERPAQPRAPRAQRGAQRHDVLEHAIGVASRFHGDLSGDVEEHAVMRWPESVPTLDRGRFRLIGRYNAGLDRRARVQFASDLDRIPGLNGALVSGNHAAARLGHALAHTTQTIAAVA